MYTFSCSPDIVCRYRVEVTWTRVNLLLKFIWILSSPGNSQGGGPVSSRILISFLIPSIAIFQGASSGHRSWGILQVLWSDLRKTADQWQWSMFLVGLNSIKGKYRNNVAQTGHSVSRNVQDWCQSRVEKKKIEIICQDQAEVLAHDQWTLSAPRYGTQNTPNTPDLALSMPAEYKNGFPSFLNWFIEYK